MAEAQPGESSAIKFGRFVLDLNSKTLLKSGREVRVQAQPLSLLCILVSRPGELVSREELHGLLWPGVGFLDFDAALNSTVKKLRQALEDDAISPSFIRTAPKKGYIFIAVAQPARLSLTGAEREFKPIPITVAPRPDIQSARASPLEADPAPETMEAQALPGLALTAGTVVTARKTRRFLLATAAALVIIAAAAALLFRRGAPARLDGAKYTSNSAENSLNDCAISPDGKYLAYVDQHRVSVMTAADRSVNVLANLAPLRVSHLSWFPDSTNLLVSGSEESGNVQGLWRASVVGNYPPVPLFAGFPDGRVSPDGRHYALIAPDRNEIRLATADGSETRSLVRAHEVHEICWSPDSTRVYFWARDEQWFNRIESVAIIGDRGAGERAEAFKTTGGLESLVLLPRNRVLYTADEGRDKGTDVFQLKVGATNGKASGSPEFLQTIQGYQLVNLTATVDGSRIAYLQGEEEATTWTGELLDGNMRLENPHRLALKDGDSYPHGWTSDSRFVLFESRFAGNKWNIFKQESGASEAQSLIYNLPPAIRPTAAPGGKWLLYQAFDHRDRIMRIPAQGGPPVQIATINGIFHCPLAPGRPCIIGESSGNRITFSYLDSSRGRLGKWRDYSPELPLIDWDVSPDGSTLAVLNRDGDGNHITLLKADEPLRQIIVPDARALQSLNWWANGEGFFCSSATRDAVSLLSISLDLKVSVLDKDVGATPSWAVPSPDGHAIAFVVHLKHYNAWIASP